MSAPLLAIEGLTVGYSGAAVVRDLDLTVAAGEVVALLGPNGAGKTTTLRAVSGLIRPLAGSIRYHDEDIAGVAPHELTRRGLVQVPDDRGIFFGLTVAEHFRLAYRGERPNFDAVVGHFPALAALRGRRAGLLSGGEQQMLGLARALARNPRLILLDEMSLGLAPVVVERLLPVLRKVADEQGIGVLLVEQHADLALEIADRGIVLAHGELMLEGPADELRQDRNVLATSYLGDERTKDS